LFVQEYNCGFVIEPENTDAIILAIKRVFALRPLNQLELSPTPRTMLKLICTYLLI
jgi:hypothetical protein